MCSFVTSCWPERSEGQQKGDKRAHSFSDKGNKNKKLPKAFQVVAYYFLSPPNGLPCFKYRKVIIQITDNERGRVGRVNHCAVLIIDDERGLSRES